MNKPTDKPIEKIPKWLSERLSSDDLDSIEKAIHKAELKTSGELVPIIVRRSSTIGHVPLTLLLFFTTLWFIVDWILNLYTNIALLESPLFMGGGLIFILLLTRILSPLEWVERVLTPRYDQSLQVNQRAEIEFFESNIRETRDATGILIMISLMEHRAVVIADKAINDKLPPETWDKVIHEMILGIKNKNIAEGMIKGIDICGNLLSQHFPLLPDDTNELPNHLIIKG